MRLSQIWEQPYHSSGTPHTNLLITVSKHIQATTTKLNMADGSLMRALGMTALCLRIVGLNSLTLLLYATDC